MQVVFMPTMGGTQHAECGHLAGMGVAVLPGARQQLQFLAGEGHRVDLAVLTRPQPAIAMLGPVRQYAPRAAVVYDTVDLHHVRLAREAALADSEGHVNRFRRRAEAATHRELERVLVDECDVTLVVSDAEADAVRRLVPGSDVRVLSNIHPDVTTRPTPRSQHIGFVGNYLHRPNVDAVSWFVGHVLPRVLRAEPEVVFDVLGADPPPQIRALAGAAVRVHGWVPDLGPHLRRLAVGVAPLRFGAGVKGKVGELVSHGVPVVGTPTAFEGMALRDGVHVEVAAEPAELATRIVGLLQDRERAGRLARSAAQQLSARFGRRAALTTLTDLLDDRILHAHRP